MILNIFLGRNQIENTYLQLKTKRKKKELGKLEVITKEEPSLKDIFYTVAVCKNQSKCQNTADMTKKLTFRTGSSLKIHVCLCNIVATQRAFT